MPVFDNFSPRPSRAREIHWLGFEEGLKKAADEDRLVLMFISGRWCHWCHAMDETAFSDPEIINLINERYVAVRVDCDRESDIDARYSQGGYPSTLILSPHGITLAGGAFFEARDISSLFSQAEDFYRTRKDVYYEHLHQLQAGLERSRSRKVSPERVEPVSLIGRVITQAVIHLDEQYPGFEQEPKFPYPEVLLFMLEVAEYEEDEELLELPESILTAMLEGELFDREEGGFFRYCRRRDWTEPQSNKHLFDNALLIQLYASALRITGRSAYEQAVRESIDYLDSFFELDNGLFATSESADESYYRLKQPERARANPPHRDEEPVTAYNARLAAALIEAGEALADEQITDAGIRLLESILAVSNTLITRVPGDNQSRKLLYDIAGVFNASTTAAIKVDHSFAGISLKLFESMISDFYDPVRLVFNDRVHARNDPGALDIRYAPLRENAMIASSLCDLVRLQLVDADSVRFSQQIIDVFAPSVDDHGLLSAPLGVACVRQLRLEEAN